MGKRILVQRRGRGSPTFRALTHRRRGAVKYPPLTLMPKRGYLKAKVMKLMHDPGRGSPIAQIHLENGESYLCLVPEGTAVDQEIRIGSRAGVRAGHILPLGKIPAGTPIFNIEAQPGDGGKFVRSSGTYATIVTHTRGKTTIRLPSGKTRTFSSTSRATIGVVSGGGRPEKPFLKAGHKHKYKRAKGHTYPKVRGVAMNPVDHPHGGGSKQRPGGPSSVKRTTPPGRKVGLIAPKRAGRKKRG
ncbi:MAG: 50S ribosomal protein L2 [Promethearchaeota archaeon]